MTIYDPGSRQPINPGTDKWHQVQSNRRTEIGMPVPVPPQEQAGLRPPAGRSRTAGRVYFVIVAVLFGFPTLVTAAYGSPMAFAFGFLFFMFGVVPLLFVLAARQRHH